MKAYRIHAPHTLKLDEMDALPVGENCVKLKNLICGLTEADIAVYEGRGETKFPIIPVRQNVGFVSEVGSNVTGIQRGNRVVVYPSASCHTCKACRDSKSYDCEKPLLFGVEEDGFLSDFSVVSADDVYIIPDRIKDEEAVFIEHVALALNAISRLNIDKGDQIVIFGATVDGIILAQVAMYYQAVPIMVDLREDMLSIAQKAGVYFTVNAVNDDVYKKILGLTGGHMADACAYLVGSGLPMQNVCDYTAMHGRIAVIGKMFDSDMTCSIKSLLDKNLNLYTVVGCGKNYPAAINLLANRTIAVDQLYDKMFQFSDAQTAFEELSSGTDDGALKSLIKF